jgi:hypothetical protein
MSDKTYYLCEFRIDGRRLYVVWYSNDKDGLARLSDGKIASSAEERQMRAFCHANSMSLMPEPPVAYDFDIIVAWCNRPTAETIDPVSFLNVWNMLDDAQSFQFEVRSLYDMTSRGAQEIYDKLFFANNLPAVTPPGARYEPVWSQEEIEVLSHIYRLGLAELRANLHCID